MTLGSIFGDVLFKGRKAVALQRIPSHVLVALSAIKHVIPFVVQLVILKLSPGNQRSRRRVPSFSTVGSDQRLRTGKALLFQVGSTSRSWFVSIPYQSLDGHAEFMGCCLHDQGNNG